MDKEAFVYCWTDHFKNMLYVGVHKGTVNDGYVCSSKIMLKEYKDRPQDFTRQIIAFGIYEDMYKFESKILQTERVIDNPHYYNINMNNGYYRNKGATLSEEHKENIRKAKEKIIHPMLNKHHSIESRLKMSVSRKKYMEEHGITMKGENHLMFNRKHTPEHCERIKKALTGKKRSIEVATKAGHNRSGIYRITTPDGEIFDIKNLNKFCKENFLHLSNMFNRGKSKGFLCENLHTKLLVD